VPKSVPTR